jgi:hypothetical protein
MTTYNETLSNMAQLQHRQLAKWLGRHVAFLSETETQANYLVILQDFYAGITYNKQTELYTVYRLNDDLEPLSFITVSIGSYMVMQLFTKRRLVAALEVLK